MVLMPKRTKFRKQQKGNIRGLSKRGNFVAFGDFGMQSLERGLIRSNEIESCRVAITRAFNRKGGVWTRIFPDKPITKKAAETRMGSGKGDIDHYSAPVKPGRILFEVGNVSREQARKALRLAAAKLRIRTKFVERLERIGK